MGETAVTVLKFSIRISFFAVLAIALVTFFNLFLGMLVFANSSGVLTEILAIVQMWLPFDLNVVLVWFTTVFFALVAYKLAQTVLNMINQLVGEN